MKATGNTEPPDFSLVTGGMLFRAYRRAHLSGEELQFVRRRALVIAMSVWLPLLLLSILHGDALNGDINLPFLHDIEVNVRFLIALPLLIVGDVTVHLYLRSAARNFINRGIVLKEDTPRFYAAVNAAKRVRDSFAVELALVFLVYTLGQWIWRNHVAMSSTTWYARPDATHLHLTPAGCWFVYVSVPIFQFLLIRWYMRMVLWFWFLGQVSRLNLRLTAAHPDLAGGIGFLGVSSYGFGPILAAQGSLLSGMIATRVLFEGQRLQSFRVEAAESIFVFILCVLGPLLMFTPKLIQAKRIGFGKFGALAQQYIFGFEDKWIGSGTPETSKLLGSGDIQSLADMGNSYAVVRNMRIIPFGVTVITRLALVTVIPLFPLALIALSVDELVSRLVKLLF
jgi:hypothetical protein